MLFRSVAVPQDGYKFIGWNSSLNQAFGANTTITAQYQAMAAEEVTVIYEADGKVVGTEAVKKGNKPQAVPDDPTKTYYEFKGWQIDGTGTVYDKEGVKTVVINNATRFVAKFEASDDIIPGEDPKPADYVTVIFDKGEGKALAGITKFHVKKNKEVDLTSVAPTAVPQDGYKFKEWEGGLSRIFDNDATIKALYEELADIIPGDEPKPSEESS